VAPGRRVLVLSNATRGASVTADDADMRAMPPPGLRGFARDDLAEELCQ
jgi:hypothetical protein